MSLDVTWSPPLQPNGQIISYELSYLEESPNGKLHSLASVHSFKCVPGQIAPSVTCLTTSASLIANPGVASSLTAQSYTFVEIYHEIISTVILLLSADTFKNGFQLQANVFARSTG